jgi:hypothetical protein
MSDESIIIPIIISAQSAVKEIKDLGKEAEKTTATFKSFSTSSSAAMQTFSVQAKAATASMAGFSKGSMAGMSGFIAQAKAAQASMTPLASAGNVVTSSLKGMGASLLSAVSPTGLLVGAVTGLVFSLANMVFGAHEASEASKRLKKAAEEAAGGITQELVQLTSLVGIITNVNASQGDREKALKAVNEQYLKYLPNLNNEKITLDNITTSYDNITDALLRQAVVKGLQSEIEDIVKKTATAITKLSIEEEKKNIQTQKSAALEKQKLAQDSVKIDYFKQETRAVKDGNLALIDRNAEMSRSIAANTSFEARVTALKNKLKDELAPLLNLTKNFSDLNLNLETHKEIKIKPDKVKIEKPRDLSFAADFNFADALFKTIKMPHGAEGQVVKIPVSFEAGDAGNKGGNIGEIIKPQLTAAELEFQKFSDSINASIQSIAVEGITNIAEDLGKALGGGDLKDVFKTFANIIASGLITIGKQMIAMSPVIKALKIALKTMNPVVQLAAGIALVAIGSALRASLGHGVKGFAQGGLVSGSVFGNVGEGMGTHAGNPEVIMPLDKLKGFFRNMVGANMGYSASGRMGTAGYSLALPQRVELFASGRTLNGVLTLEQISQKRTG